VRYRKGTIVVSPHGDIPLLRYVRNCRFISHRQLFQLLRQDSVLSARSSFNWRIERLLERGYMERLAGTNFQGSPVYTITRDGLLELEANGDFAVALHSMTRQMPHPLQVHHALELTEIRVALATNHLLVRWQSEIEITSSNLVSRTPLEKDYDAIVDIWVGDEVRRFALEYERNLKGLKKYEAIKAAIEADDQVPCILFIAPHFDLLLGLMQELTPSTKRMAFSLMKPFCQQLLATSLVTGDDSPMVSFEEFLRYSHPLYIQAS